MKYMYVIMLLLPLYSLSQDCKLKKETDDFTHEIKLTTGFVPFTGPAGRILLSIDATKSEIDFFFSLAASGTSKCYDNSSTAVIIFDDNKVKSNFKNNGSMNCDGLFHINFRNSASTTYALQRLATQKVNTISFTGNDKKVTNFVLKDDQKQLLLDLAACVVKESKILLQ